MKQFIIMMSIFSSFFGMVEQQFEQIKILSATDFKKAIQRKDIQLIDVRTNQEFDSGHIKNAINVDFFKRNDFYQYFNKLNKDKAIYLYCRSGNRSQNASKLLIKLGFKEIYDLKGGYLNWKNK